VASRRFQKILTPSFSPFPVLFDADLAADLLPFRKFRHVVYHGYGFQFDWDRMKEGLGKVKNVYSRFASSVADYATNLKS